MASCYTMHNSSFMDRNAMLLLLFIPTFMPGKNEEIQNTTSALHCHHKIDVRTPKL